MKFRHTNFMRLIYATLLALPFVAILSRVIYVQSNKNAYQSAEIENSYQTYEKVYEYETNEVNDANDLIVGNIYKVSITKTELDLLPNSTRFIQFTGIFQYKVYRDFTSQEVEYKTSVDDLDNAKLGFFKDLPNWLMVNYINTNNQSITYLYQSNYELVQDLTFYILFESLTYPQFIDYISESDYFGQEDVIIEDHTGTTLDNVFEYSVNKFIENNNFGKINLFQWTTDLFFDSNDVNNMYVGFINWYLNYTLLVSATYILFLVLMWFINYARRLLERGMNYDW